MPVVESIADLSDYEEDLKIQELLRSEGMMGANLEILRKDLRGTWAYLTVVKIEEWSSEVKQQLARDFGGGDYRVRIRHMQGERRGTYGKSFEFTIDKSIVPRRDDPQAVEIRQAVAEVKSGGGMMPFILSMIQMQAESNRQMITMQQENTKTLVATLTAAFARPVQPPSEKLIEALATRAFAAPPNELGNLITALIQLKRVTDQGLADRGTDGQPKRDFLEVVIEALPALINAFRTATGATAAPAPAELAKRVGPGVPAAPVAVAVPVPPAEAPLVIVSAGEGAPPIAPAGEAALVTLKAALAPLLPQLCQFADNQRDPEEIADQLSDDLTDEQLIALQAFLTRPDWLAIMIDVHEPVAIRSVWFTQLHDALLTIEPAPAAVPPAAG